MISILIPIYNTAKFLPQCLNSLKQQTYTDWEAILVDDASPDNAHAICEAYASQNSRFKILHKKRNEGVEKARWDGIQLARGEYITFLDSDDWLEKHALVTMISSMEQYDCDYVEMNYRICFDRHGLITRPHTPSITGLLQQPDLYSKYYISYFGVTKLGHTLCRKLYKADFLRQYFPEPSGVYFGEDMLANISLFPHLTRIYISDNVVYNYRTGGMTTKYNPQLLHDVKKMYRMRRELIANKNLPLDYRIYLDIEAKNFLQIATYQRIKFELNKQEASVFLERELLDPMWDEVIETLKSRNDSSAFSFALCHKDIEQMILISSHQSLKQKIKHSLRMLATAIGKKL